MSNQLMIIDDDRAVQMMLRTVLECEHFEVLSADDGLTALMQLENTTPDLILLDLMMPNMDGCAFVKELERRGLRAAIPVIVLTADVQAGSIVEKMQVDSYLVKPFRLAELLKQIRQLLERSKQHAIG